jgi:hypothetical protein
MYFKSRRLHLDKFAKGQGKRFQDALILLTVIAIGVLCFWLVLRVLLNTEHPILPVSSEDMCTLRPCNCWRDVFAPTLHVGDLIVVQGVSAKDVKVSYPNSDIVVFYAPKQDSQQVDWLIITRVMASEEKDGIIYFKTKSDGKGLHIWPEIPDASESDLWYNDYRGENYTWGGMISERLLVGKVILRIPWVGHIMLFMYSPFLGTSVIIFLLIALIIIKFVIPAFTCKEVEKRDGKSF